jgi:hypothetical protein
MCYPPNFWFDFVEGAEEGLEALAGRYELSSVTHRGPLLDQETHWISTMMYSPEIEEREGDGLFLPFDRIYPMHEVEPVGLGKAEVYQRLGVGKIIDDDADVALSCANRGIHAIVPARPWNASLPRRDLITRVSDWEEIVGVLGAA